MRVALGGMFHETNTFSAMRTSWREFEAGAFVKGMEILEKYKGTRGTIGGVIDASQEYEIELVPIVYASATPGGIVDDDVVEKVAEELCEGIKPDIEGIILVLHGAMVTEKREDPEGYILSRLRKRVGQGIPIVCTTDFHANITPEMVRLSQCIVGYDTYPHVDYYDRAYDAVRIMSGILKNEIKPITVFSKAPLAPVVQTMLTSVYPMKDIMELAHDIEKNHKVVNVTVAGGFPYADIKWAGMSVLVTTDDDYDSALSFCNQLEQKIYSLHKDFVFENKTPAEGVAEAKKSEDFPLILVDSSDNVGGGSSGDGTELLEEMLKQGLQSALIIIKDSEAVKLAEQTGVGNVLKTVIGAKTDNMHGKPVLIEGVIKKICDGRYKSERTGEEVFMGKTAVVETKGIIIVLTTERVPAFDLESVRSLGIQPENLKYIVVKGAIQWKQSFGSIAKKWIEVDTAGVTSSNLKRFNFNNIRRPIFPLDTHVTMEDFIRG